MNCTKIGYNDENAALLGGVIGKCRILCFGHRFGLKMDADVHEIMGATMVNDIYPKLLSGNLAKCKYPENGNRRGSKLFDKT